MTAMTAEQVEARIPELLDALRAVHLSPELEEVRGRLALFAVPQSLPADESEADSSLSTFRFRPVPIRGEPLSHTIIRDREDRF